MFHHSGHLSGEPPEKNNKLIEDALGASEVLVGMSQVLPDF